MIENQKTPNAVELIGLKWKSYRAAVLKAGGTDVNMVLAELLFYGGATAAMSVINGLFESSLPAEKVAESLNGISRELMEHEFPEVEVAAPTSRQSVQ